MCQQKKFEELSAKYGGEFATLMKCSRYNGPVIFFDLRLSHLEALKISNPEEKIMPLIEMLDFFIRGYEQMNSFILCDDVTSCRFYSTNQICKLLSAKNPKPEFMWHNIFPMAEFHCFLPSDVHMNFPLAEWYACHGNAFACMRFREIPKSYFKYGKEIVGVENAGFMKNVPNEEIKKSDEAIANWITKNMNGCSCYVLFVGERTYLSRWVHYEMELACQLNLGIL